MARAIGVSGLAAIAVLALIVYGVDPAAAPGGYVGVDVFFVIAGYLVAAQIAPDAEEDRLSLGGLYARMALWASPALAVMLAVVSTAVWAVWPEQGAADYSLTLAASSIFAANFAFAAFVDFFGPVARAVPLLHLWAVALAAQVLVALPLIHAAAARFGPDRLRLVLIVLTVVSYWSGVWGETAAPERAWYMPHMRAWEVLIGALLVFGDLPEIASRIWRALLALIGLAAVGAAFLLFDGDLRQPGLATMVPVLGAAMVIYAGANPVSALLEARPLAAIGAAAFSIYLWHWPILVIARSLAPGLAATVVALAVIAAAAAASHWWLERPFRGADPNWRALALSLLALAALFAAAVVGVAG